MAQKKILLQLLAFILCIFLVLPTSLTGQAKYKVDKTQLKEQFKKYQIIEVNSQRLFDELSSNRDEVKTISFQGRRLKLWDSGILSDKYFLSIATEEGIVQRGAPKTMAMTGETENGERVSLTFADNFIFGYFTEDGIKRFIEPLYHYDSKSPENYFVIYDEDNLKPARKNTCGVTHMHDKTREIEDYVESRGSRMACLEVEYALAGDWLMVLKYGSVSAVENHNIGILNNVQTNYDDEFADELQLILPTQWISSCSTCDPWSSSTNSNVLLNSFTNWGPSGFGVTHDIGGLWSDRNFDGSTIGLAWVSTVCTGNRYHIMQDFSSNANFKRVLQAHEMGHNFSASHDPSGSFTIMAPSVNSSTVWSNQSVNQIQNHYNSRWCLSSCGPSAPPVADFSATINSPCAPGSVQFNDQSQGTTTSWQWSFPGGTPATSTLQNPVVTYNQPGVYNATLTAGNQAGTNTITKNNIVTIETTPVASFSFIVDGRNITVFNNSQHGQDYLWEFGDGNISTEFETSHTYEEDGDYIVSLFVSNICGADIAVDLAIVITPPSCDFNGNPRTGCDELTVQFEANASSNTLYYLWSFPGGTPSTSDLANPTVSYETPGEFNVQLTVSNNNFSFNQTETQYIKFGFSAVADFDFTILGQEVSFNNLSQNGQTYNWNFGDGNNSTEENPVHEYDESGQYQVTLITTTPVCGNDTITRVVNITLEPTASFSTNGDPRGCSEFEIQFINSSFNSSGSIEWIFPGGLPETSDEENPLVLYTVPGLYDVTLIVSDGVLFDTLTLEDYIEVITIPTTGFNFLMEEDEIIFTNLTPDGEVLSWDFGDGNSSSEENPVYGYQAEAYYDVTLICENECGTSELTQTVAFIRPPVAVIGLPNTLTICEGNSIQFMDESFTIIETRLWSFEGGAPNNSTEMSPIVIYSTAGSYNVTLEVGNINGIDTQFLQSVIEVISIPTPEININIEGNVVTLTNQTQGSVFTLWTLPDGSTSDENPVSFTVPENGEYSYSLNTGNQCGEVSSQRSFSMQAYPTAGFSAQNTSGCSPFEVEFINESAEGIEYFWVFEGGNPATSQEQSPTVLYENPGTYAVSLKVTNTFGESEVLFDNYIEVGDVPDTDFDFIQNGFNFRFNNSTENGTTYLWQFGDGNTSTETNPEYTYPAEGTYLIILEASNECGSSKKEITIELSNNIPTASFSQSAFTACVPVEIAFTDESDNNPTSWAWTFNGGEPSESNEQNPVVTYNTPGIYDVSLRVTNDFGTSTLESVDAVVIYDVPRPDFEFEILDEQEGTVAFNYTGNLVSTYLWTFGDGNNSDYKDPVHSYDEDGSYEVILEVTNDCGTEKITYLVVIMRSSVTEINNQLNFQLMPNPSQGIVYIQLVKELTTEHKLEIFNSQGQMIWNRRVVELSGGNNQLILNLQNLSEGVYFVRIIGEHEFGMQKLVITR
jgi:PKD repeat protein